jgi:DNA helicase II / ATP-dependent DNA helicase PcrA
MYKSNIQPLSNVYPLKKGFMEDNEFHKQVRGKNAIEIMVDRIKRHTGDKTPLTAVQKDQLEEGMYCSLLGDKNELVFGFIEVNGKLRAECRCYNYKCRLFKQCRPDYDLSVLPSPVNQEIISSPSNRVESKGEQDINEITNYPVISGKGQSTEDYDIIIDFTEDDFDYSVETDNEHINYQDAAIKALPEQKMLVSAGPGTGKTYTLLKRLEFLIQDCNLHIDDIVVLSFSRAAIAEIKQRTLNMVDLNEYGYNVLQDVDIRTFDSFATYMLKEVVPELDLSGKDYNTRIELAIDCIKNNPEIFNDTKHIIVDEIQDLVAVRARLVQTILQYSNCGFTFLGDPCQAIYEYQVEDTPNEPGSLAFLKWLTETYKDSLVKINFEHNYRQSTSLAKVGQHVRKGLLSGDKARQLDRLLQAAESLPSLGNIQDISDRFEFESGRKYAVLCRDNGEVLKVSRLLRDQNIKHIVQRPSTQKLMDRWLAQLLGRYSKRFMGFDDFQELMNNSDLESLLSNIEEYWGILQKIENDYSSSINMDTLFNNLSRNYLMYTELESVSRSNIVVSSIHRAKGREYDEVIILDNGIYERGRWSDDSGEVRTYYVAMTRPKESLYLTSLDPYYRRKVRERWIFTGMNRKGKPYISNIEIGLEKDVEITSFVDVRLFGSESGVLDNQEYICKNVRPGDSVTLVKTQDDNQEFVKYMIYHNGHCIGSMSNHFSDDVFQSLKEVQNFYSRNNIEYYPAELNEVYVDDIYTYVMPFTDLNVPEIYRRSRVCNGVYLTGLASFSWTN